MRRSTGPLANAKRTKLTPVSELTVKSNDSRVLNALTYFNFKDDSEKEEVLQAAVNWISEIDRCTAAFRRAKRTWVPTFGDIIAKKDLNKPRTGFASFNQKSPHPIVSCLLEGITVEDEKHKVCLSPAYVVPYFQSGQRARLATYWLGILSDPISPPVDMTPFVIPDLKVECGTTPGVNSFPPPILRNLRSEILCIEERNPTLIPPYSKYASMLKCDETKTLQPDNYVEITEKAEGLIVAYSLQNKHSLEWTDEIRMQVLGKHAKVFVKEGGPMILLCALEKKILVDYCEKNSDDVWNKGTKVRQDVTKLLEEKLSKMKGKKMKIPAGIKEIAKCFAKKRIKGLKLLLK